MVFCKKWVLIWDYITAQGLGRVRTMGCLLWDALLCGCDQACLVVGRSPSSDVLMDSFGEVGAHSGVVHCIVQYNRVC